VSGAGLLLPLWLAALAAPAAPAPPTPPVPAAALVSAPAPAAAPLLASPRPPAASTPPVPAAALIDAPAPPSATRLAAPAPPSAPPAAPAVSVVLPAGEATVGDRLEAVVTLRVPAARLAAEPRFPAWRGAWGEAEVREAAEARRAADEPGGVAVYRQRLVLAAFRPGKVALPPAAIAVPLRSGTVQAWTPGGLALGVRSVLPAAAAGVKPPAPRPPSPLRQLPFGLAFFCALAALAAAVVAGGWALWRRERRRRAALPAVAPPLAPLAELLAALDRLATGAPSPLALHTGVSQALRRFLGRTAAFPAPESTTTEIQRLLLARGWPSAQVRPAIELLRACDLVKFARQQVPPERAGERLAAARRLGEQIDERAALERAPARLEAAG
jgi:hypothetical protein